MTDQQVANLISEFRVPLHVRRHCAAVANFAVKLGEQLKAAGEKIDLDLLRHAALLHDMFRVIDFKKFDLRNWPDKTTEEDIAFWEALRKKYAGRGHEEVAFEILRERGFPEVAEVILKHRYLQIKEGFDRWEEKLLYYADKRTLHDTTVSLKERLEEGRQRNAPETIGTAESKEIDEKIFALEAEILKKLQQNNDIIRIEMDIQKLID